MVVMAGYRMLTVGGHIEGYTPEGEFAFSADTVKEAMEELREEFGAPTAA